uniref:Uncharacterized protein n=1 Tax=Rhizophora mucronata TaxID=61149 RepID=A0A2P2PKD4_RHIMU
MEENRKPGRQTKLCKNQFSRKNVLTTLSMPQKIALLVILIVFYLTMCGFACASEQECSNIH